MEKLNRQNTEHSHINIEAEGDGRSGRQDLETLILEEPHTSVAQSDERQEEAEERQDEEGEGGIFEDSEPEEQEKEEEKQNGEDVSLENRGKVKDDVKTTHREESSKSEKAWLCRASVLQYDRCVLAKLPYIFMLLAIKFIKLTIYFLYLYFFGSLSQLRGNYFVGEEKGNFKPHHTFIFCAFLSEAPRRLVMWPLVANATSRKKTLEKTTSKRAGWRTVKWKGLMDRS